MEIKCTVVDIIFQNIENGYTVINVDADGSLLTAVGVFPNVREGEFLRLTGEMKFNKKFGEQFEVRKVEVQKPTSLVAVERYLASGLFTGIGAVTAGKIVRVFGEKTLDVIQNRPEELAKVQGISRKKAAAIGEQYKENNAMRDVILFLQELDVSNTFAMKIFKKYGADAIGMIKANPYRLVSDIDGIGFLKADKFAAKLGITGENKFRVQAGILHSLNEAEGRNGHTYLPENELLESSERLLGIEDKKLLTDALQELILKGDLKVYVVRESGEAKRLIALKKNFILENSIAAKLVAYDMREPEAVVDTDKAVGVFEQQNGIKFHENQIEAVRFAVEKGAVVISGGPGTGKTTIIKCIAEIMRDAGKKVVLAAPTGRAAKRMSEATGYEAQTLHRLLKLNGGGDYGKKSEFQYNEMNPLEADVVIVDEISMADIYIFNALLSALHHETRLILVGDKDQLPSVSAGNVLADILESKVLPSVFLKYIYRQAEGSLIVDNAHRINAGEMPLIDNRSKDFFFDDKSDEEDMVAAAVSMVKERLPKFLGVSSDDIQVLSPVKKGVAGVESLNRRLQSALNPTGAETLYRDTVYRVGDRVMHIRNDYGLEWEKRTDLEGGGELAESGAGVFNGEMGRVVRIDDEFVTVEFEDGKLVKYNRADLDELMLSYAISVHKSQGSEFPVAVIVVGGQNNYMLLNKNLLYTAVTRAKRMVVIVGSSKSVYRMVKNTHVQKRNTLLKELIADNRKKLANFLRG